jgi:SAM-dependent methyltransferase
MTAGVDLDRAVADTVHLESLPGVVDRLLQQCHDLGPPTLTAISRVGDAVVADLRGPLRPVAALRMFSALSVVLGTAVGDPAEAVEALRRSRTGGVLAALGDEPAFRVDPVADRWALRDAVAAGLGWRNDPRDWQVNLTRAGDLLLAQVGPLHSSRRFPALRRVPAATNPLLAALLVQLAKPRRGDVLLDPFCGSGTLLVEAAALGLDLVLLGADLDPAALAQAAGNRGVVPTAALLRADAARLPVADGAVDRVVANLPFGKRVGSHAGNLALYPAFLAELTRVLRPDGRAALLTDDKALFRRAVEATRGVRLLREVKLATPGGELHPSAFVLDRTRAARRRSVRAG